MASAYNQGQNNIYVNDKEHDRSMYPLNAEFDAHSEPPPGGPGPSMKSATSTRVFAPKDQIERELAFTSATPTASLNLNFSGISAPQLPQEHTMQSNMGGHGFPQTPAGDAAAAISSRNGNRPGPQSQLGDCFMQGNGYQWPFQALMPGPSSGFEEGAIPVPLPGPRSEVWTTAQENHLKESKRNGNTYPEIRHSMWVAFGVDRSVNVLSKRHRMMLERDAKDNVRFPFASHSDGEFANNTRLL
jgi:hypothetical protein